MGIKNYIGRVMLFLSTACSTANMPLRGDTPNYTQGGPSCAIKEDQESVTYICDVNGDNVVDRIVQLNSDGNQGTIEFIVSNSCSLKRVRFRSPISGNFDCVGSPQELTEQDTCFVPRESLGTIEVDLQTFCKYFRTSPKTKGDFYLRWQSTTL